jgi:hypothetical protein
MADLTLSVEAIGMAKHCIYVVAIVALLVSCSGYRTALANDIYMAQSATGGANGADCNDAYDYDFFNAARNWGSGANEIGPGTTVHLCGTFTASSPNTTALTFRGSGASSSPITVLFEPGAVLSSPAWAATGAINLNRQSYVIVDGGKNGRIQNTANGSGLANQQVSNGIYGSNNSMVHDITIRHLNVSNIYQYVADSLPDEGAARASQAIELYSSGSNIIIYGNTLSKCGQACIDISAAGSNNATNWQVYSNTLSGATWFIDLSAGALNATFSNVLVYDNDLSDNSPFWNTDNHFHCDPIFVRAPGGGQGGSSSYSNVLIYNNYFHGPLGNMSGMIFFSYNGGGGNYVFNNIFQPSSTYTLRPCAGDGWVAPNYNNVAYVGVYNNTFDSSAASACQGSAPWGGRVTALGGGGTSWPDTMVWENNIETYMFGTELKSGTLTSDYNIWFGITSVRNGGGSLAFKIGRNYYTYSNWKAQGYDAHSPGPGADPKLDATDHLGKGSAAVAAGINLSSLCAGSLVPLCADKAGNPRPGGSTHWDLGAYNSANPRTPMKHGAVAH